MERTAEVAAFNRVARPSAAVMIGLLMLLAAVAAPSPADATSGPCGSTANAPVRHVVWIWMENRSYRDIMGSTQAPYLNSLAAQCLSATQARAITHPSAPNYVAASGGVPLSKLPATDCTNCRQSGPSIFTQNVTWRAYEESMTTNCRLTKDSGGRYVVRHNPATYFTAARSRCKVDDVPYSTLASDLARGALRQLSVVTPNLDHDMHDGGVSAGDAWLAAQVPALLGRPEYQDGSTVIFILWDEGSGGGSLKGADCTTVASESCHVPLLVLRSNAPAAKLVTTINHYDVLATTEYLLGQPILGSGVPFSLPTTQSPSSGVVQPRRG
jgi:phospholipase C